MTSSKGKQKRVEGKSANKSKRLSGKKSNNDDDFVEEPLLLAHGEWDNIIEKAIKTKKKRVKTSAQKRKETSGKQHASTSGTKDSAKEKKKRKRNKNPKGITCKRRRIRKADEDGDGEAVANKETKYPKLNTRSTLAAFFKSIRNLNEAQRRAVQAIGFGRILEFSIKDVPSKLAYWVLDKYNSRNGYLEIDSSCKVEIQEDDVYRVFGFPKGDRKIETFARTTVNELFNEWMAFFNGISREKIMIKNVLDKMLSCADGRTWFVRHFMIAMAFSLIGSCTSGTVHPFILRCLENVNELSSWNWGEFVIRTLIDHNRSWVEHQTKLFAGPVVFLMLFYVDGIEIHRQTNTRNFPVFVNWTSALLRERQSIEKYDKFCGGGCLLEPIQLSSEYPNPQNNATENAEDQHQGETETTATKFMKESVAIAERIEGLRALLRDAP